MFLGVGSLPYFSEDEEESGESSNQEEESDGEQSEEHDREDILLEEQLERRTNLGKFTVKPLTNFTFVSPFLTIHPLPLNYYSPHTFTHPFNHVIHWHTLAELIHPNYFISSLNTKRPSLCCDSGNHRNRQLFMPPIYLYTSV